MASKKKKVSRRTFLRALAAGAIGGAMGPDFFAQSTRAAPAFPSSAPSGSKTGMVGVALASSIVNEKPRLDLISLRNRHLLATFEYIHASHAIVPVETLNRFFVHGRSSRTGNGVIWGVEVNLATEEWHVIYEQQLAGGLVLHWQPNRDYSLIQYNTIEDQALHVLDTKTLELQTYPGGGTHANMAFFPSNNWLVATDHLRRGTKLRVIERSSKTVLAETSVGDWGHGVTVNDKIGRAFVWANDGVHRVSLATKNLGAHLGVIKPAEQGQRSWFCWTPQGSRYSHDQTWNPGDRFSPWLTVLDMENEKLERIETGNEQPGTLQISPDGNMGVSGSHSSNNVCLFDIQANIFLGTVGVGNGHKGFFDRDAAFSRDRTIAFVTNPPDHTLTAIDIQRRQTIDQIDLPATPVWMKVLTQPMPERTPPLESPA